MCALSKTVIKFSKRTEAVQSKPVSHFANWETEDPKCNLVTVLHSHSWRARAPTLPGDLAGVCPVPPPHMYTDTRLFSLGIFPYVLSAYTYFIYISSYSYLSSIIHIFLIYLIMLTYLYTYQLLNILQLTYFLNDTFT